MSDIVERVARASEEVKRLSRELDITNADHIALWLEGNTIQDEPMSQCVSWLACRIVEAHERAIAAMQADAAPVAWMPIETAPQDGTWFLTWGKDEGHGLRRILPSMIGNPDRDKWGDATHWMQLPIAPVADRGAVLNATQRYSTSDKLRDAVEVWRDAFGLPHQAAAAVIEADRAALVAEIVEDLRDHWERGGLVAGDELADMIEAKWGGK